MKKTERDADIRAVIRDMHEFEIDRLPDNEVLKERYQLSEMFRHRMEQLIRRVQWRERRRKGIGYGIAVAAVILLLFGVSHPKAIAQAAETFMRWFDDHVSFQFKKDVELESVPEYELSYVPEGMELVNEMYGQYTGVVEYGNGEEGIVLVYGPSDGVSNVNNEGVDFYTFTRNGTLFYCFEAQGEEKDSMIMWLSENENIVFQISGNLSVEELLQVYEGVREK